MDYVLEIVVSVALTFLAALFVFVFLHLTDVNALHLSYMNCFWLTSAGTAIVRLALLLDDDMF